MTHACTGGTCPADVEFCFLVLAIGESSSSSTTFEGTLIANVRPVDSHVSIDGEVWKSGLLEKPRPTLGPPTADLGLENRSVLSEIVHAFGK